MLNAPTEEYCEIPRTNVIPFPRAFARRDPAEAGPFGMAATAMDVTSRENRKRLIQADHRALRELIDARANARSMILRSEIEIRLLKAMGAGNAAR